MHILKNGALRKSTVALAAVCAILGVAESVVRA